MTNALRATLSGGDLRSIGRSEEVAKSIGGDASSFGDLFSCMLDSDRRVRMRAADAVEKSTRQHPSLLKSWKKPLLEQVAFSCDKEMRWHVAQLLPRLTLTKREQDRVIEILNEYLSDKSSIVRTFSMQALTDLAMKDERLKANVRRTIKPLAETGTPAMRARGRKLLEQLD